jgi:integrase
MARRSKGAHLWLRPARDRGDKGVERAVWVIKDGGRQIATGCGAGERPAAEAALGTYIASKYEPARRERDISEILIADVLTVYVRDVAPRQARPEKCGERILRLIDFFGDMHLSDINGSQCRAYAESRGSNGGARRDLQDLAAAIGHHAKEGLHRSLVRVALPPRGHARQRWMTRSEVAKLLWTCWRAREVQEGKPTDKRPLRHLARALLIGVYTGSRPGAILNATWRQGPGLSWVDVANGVFHRHADGEAQTNKRQPTVRLSPRLLAHLRRWERLDAALARPPTYVITFRGHKVASLKTAFHTACKLAEIDPATMYSLRHTTASWEVAKGRSTRMIAEFLGTSEQMIRAHYGHLAPDYQVEVADSIGRH